MTDKIGRQSGVSGSMYKLGEEWKAGGGRGMLVIE